MEKNELKKKSKFESLGRNVLTMVIPGISAITIPFPFIVFRNLFVNQELGVSEFFNNSMKQWMGQGGAKNVVGSLFNGYMVTMPPYVAYKWMDLYINKNLKKHFNAEWKENGKTVQDSKKMLLCGLLSGGTSACVFNPVERIQVHQNILGKNFGRRVGMSEAISSIRKGSGLKGFYTGIPSTICRDSIYSGLVLGTSYTIKSMLEKRMGEFGENHPLVNTCISGLVTGCVTGFITNPFDLVRTIQQGAPLDSQKNSIQSLKEIINGKQVKYPITNLWKGGTMRVIRIAASSTSLLMVMEICKMFEKKIFHDV